MARSNHPMYQGDVDRSDDGSYHSMEQQQFEARRDAQMAEQDAVLDQLHVGVKGLKNNAHAINGEVVEQNAMIDDVSNRMDAAQVDLERQEAAARHVNAKKAKVCKLYGVIALLIVILLVLFLI